MTGPRLVVQSHGQPVRASAQLPRLPKKLVDVLSREEIGRLEAAAVTERDKIIIRLLADTGIRLGELVGLRPDDLVEMDRNGNIKVRGPDLPIKRGPAGTMTDDSKRYGNTTLFAALDVLSGKVIGQCHPRLPRHPHRRPQAVGLDGQG